MPVRGTPCGTADGIWLPAVRDVEGCGSSRAGLVAAGAGFHVGEEPLVLNADCEGAAAVIPEDIDIDVDAFDVPHLPQASLAAPWNAGLAAEVRQLIENGVEALGCLGVRWCRIHPEIYMDGFNEAAQFP